jgi:hypothetical protein
MLIECKIRRRSGSTSTMNCKDGSPVTYRFLPRDADGKPIKDPEVAAQTPHTCEVKELAHQRRFVMDCAPAYAPFGAAGEKEAEERFGWSPDTGKTKPAARVAPGQPQVREEIVDDDEVPEGDGSPVTTDDDDDAAGTGDGGKASAPPESGLPTWTKPQWEEWARKTLNIGKPDDRNALEKYAKDNFGVDLDKRRGHIVLIREVYTLHQEAAKQD